MVLGNHLPKIKFITKKLNNDDNLSMNSIMEYRHILDKRLENNFAVA